MGPCRVFCLFSLSFPAIIFILHPSLTTPCNHPFLATPCSSGPPSILLAKILCCLVPHAIPVHIFFPPRFLSLFLQRVPLHIHLQHLVHHTHISRWHHYFNHCHASTETVESVAIPDPSLPPGKLSTTAP